MKAIIYGRVSSMKQNLERQITDLKRVSDFEIQKVFSEKISGFSKSSLDRPVLQKAIEYVKENDIDCIMVHEISRLGRNTVDVLNLIENFKKNNIKIYVHNLSIILNSEDLKEEIYSKLVVTIMIDLARLESEQMSYRIKSGINNRKAKGFTTGRKINSFESIDKFMSKPRSKEIELMLNKGYTVREISKILDCSPNTVVKVRKYRNHEN